MASSTPIYPTLPELLERNKQYVASAHKPRPRFDEMPALGLPKPTTVIVTCADPRLCPEEFFRLQPGEAIVFRTAGGHVGPILQDIVTLDSFLGHGTLQQLLIIHHTDCGATHFTDVGVKNDIISRHPERRAEVENWNIGAFKDLDQSVRDDVEVVRREGLMADSFRQGTKGLVWDVKSGEIREIV